MPTALSDSQGQALRVLKKNLHPTGSIFSKNLDSRASPA